MGPIVPLWSYPSMRPPIVIVLHGFDDSRGNLAAKTQ